MGPAVGQRAGGAPQGCLPPGKVRVGGELEFVFEQVARGNNYLTVLRDVEICRVCTGLRLYGHGQKPNR